MVDYLAHLFSGSFIRTLTVGIGISPIQPLARVADFTAGGEFHSAPKQNNNISQTRKRASDTYIILHRQRFVKGILQIILQ